MGVGQAGSLEDQVPQPDVTLAVVQSGEWLSAEELRRGLLARVMDSGNILLDCEGIGEVDAGSLQILLAFLEQRKSVGATVELRNVSAGLAQWFAYAGATSLMDLARLAQEA